MSEPLRLDVLGLSYDRFEKPNGNKPSVRCEYETSQGKFRTWFFPENEGYVKLKTIEFWRSHHGNLPVPATVDEFLARTPELSRTAVITVRQSTRFAEVCGLEVAQ